ncbi:hypothetical protein Leryth_000799 [Lithospermum erythrorhizon]|nr:hypothetical protein Leryth_000799 [Lithospermum erythrorhizon]
MLISVQMIINGYIFHVSDFVTHDDTAADLKGVGGASVIYLGTGDVEGAVARAVIAGAISMGEVPAAEVVGEGKVMMKDPYGNVWVIYSTSSPKISSDDDDEVESRKIAVV